MARALDIHLKPVESLVFCSDVVAAGTFRCPSTHPLFRDSGPCSHHTLVFPRTMTAIRFDDGTSFVGTPTSVALYNQHQVYFRTKISESDECDWITVADDVLLDAIARHDPAVADRPQRPFRVADAASDPATFLRQRRLFDALLSAKALDRLEVEETALGVVARVLARAYGAPPRVQRNRDDRDVVEQTKLTIARQLDRNVSLRELARRAELSPFRLCRLFRAHTGGTLTHYRHSLRLRVATERLRDRHVDLTDLALDLGYSSHSHFTTAFRRYFGMTPSAYRASA